jgi:replicative DNA helicase
VKLLALELEIPVLCLSQLNRESVKEGTRRPRLSDLRDSGAIEQDSDVVLFLHDPNKKSESPAPGYEPEHKDIELIVAKQRQGPIGTIQLRFDGATQRFRNMTRVGNVEMER